MEDRSPDSGGQQAAAPRPVIDVAYACAEDARRDRLPDAPRGLIARSPSPLLAGDTVDVRIEVARERAHVAARGLVRWATPLVRGSLVGLELQGVEHRDAVKLDLLLGIRVAGTVAETAAVAAPAAPPLSVAMLQPNGVLRQVLQHALERLAKEKVGGAALRLEAVADVPSFIASVSARRPDLAIIDCDGIETPADPIVDAVRSNEPTRRTPLILLSSGEAPEREDPYTVTMQKPVGMKVFLHAADLLLRG